MNGASGLIEAAAGPRWYVARTHPNREKLARAALKEEGLEPYLPMTVKSNRKDELYALPLFPSFIFVRLVLGAPGWTKVFSARGVAAVLGCGGRPSWVSDRLLDWIRLGELAAFERHGMQPPACALFRPGQLVRVTKGPYAEFEGVFVQQVDAKRCSLLMKLFAADRLVQADVEHVEAVD